MSDNLFFGFDKKTLKILAIVTTVIVTIIIVVVLLLQEFDSENDIGSYYTQETNSELLLNQKVAILFKATTNQVNLELDSHVGWVVNDLPLHPFAILDNTEHRQECVAKTTARALAVISPLTTKVGGVGQENQLILDAIADMNSKTFVFGLWVQSDATEKRFQSALDLVYQFGHEMMKEKDAKVVFSSTAMRGIIDRLADGDAGILSLPFGRIIEENQNDGWLTVDDRFYCGQGGARVARDILVTLKYLFPSIVSSGGGAGFLDNAIHAFDQAAKWNPWIVLETTHDIDVMHRYYNTAFRNLSKFRDTIKN